MPPPRCEGGRAHAFGGPGPDVGDPAADPLGTVRRAPNGRLLAVRWPSPPSEYPWAVADQRGSVGYETDTRVAHWPVVGAVPCSPADGMALDGSQPTSTRHHRAVRKT